MKKILFVLATMGLVGACGNSAADQILSKMESTKNKICACKDKACVEKAEGEFMEWLMKNADKLKDAEKGSKSQEEKAKKIDAEMEKCKEKIEGAAEGG